MKMLSNLLLAALCCAPSLMAQQHDIPKPSGLDFALRMNGEKMLEAFDTVRANLQNASAVVYSQRMVVAYGVVVDSEGYVVTKASEVLNKPELSMRIDRQKYEKPQLVGVDDNWDIALYKLEASGLQLPKFKQQEPTLGSWVVSNGASTRLERKAKAGIISAQPRALDSGASRPALGISFDRNSPTIIEVVANSPAAKAGVQKGDVLLQVDDTPINKLQDLSPILSKAEVGQKIKVQLQRKQQKLELELSFARFSELFPDQQKAQPPSRNDQMSGKFNQRRDRFPRVLQHDTVLHAEDVGGPLLDLDGEVVGMNIARANRSESFALPIKQVLEVFQAIKAQPDKFRPKAETPQAAQPEPGKHEL